MQRVYEIFKNKYLFYPGGCEVEDNVLKTFPLADFFWLGKITTVPHILTDFNIRLPVAGIQN